MSSEGDAASTRSAAHAGELRLDGTGVRASFPPAAASPRRIMTALTAMPIGWTGTGATTGFLHRL